MTRRGRRQHRWTPGEYDFVARMAGRIPAEEICRSLGVTRGQLDGARHVINRKGGRVSLRCDRTMSICPSCGRLRATVGADGVCEPCRRERQLAAIQARIAELLAMLPEGERAVYEASEAETGAPRRADPMPSPPDLRGLSRAERAAAERRHDTAVERWLAARLLRQVKAAQKRRERIRGKVVEAQERVSSSEKTEEEADEH